MFIQGATFIPDSRVIKVLYFLKLCYFLSPLFILLVNLTITLFRKKLNFNTCIGMWFHAQLSQISCTVSKVGLVLIPVDITRSLGWLNQTILKS